MLYNHNHTQRYLKTAGKITALTAFAGFLIFMVIFLLDLGQKEFSSAQAQSQATTSVTVLNTPPQWTASATELFASATSTPTNSGSNVFWVATGTDSNQQDYQLLICSSMATPTPGTSTTSPTCNGAGVRWAVSDKASSGVRAIAATTTLETGPFASSTGERFEWYAWICDAIDNDSRCNTTFTQGTSSTATPYSSPFHVNDRPTFTAYSDTSPGVPGSTIVFQSTSSDSDVIGGQDRVRLIVCTASSTYSTTTNLCASGEGLATTTAFVQQHATATYTIVIPTQDQNYTAYGFIIDEHGHEAGGVIQASDSTLTVDNLAPFITSSEIVINGGQDLVLTEAAGTTTGFTLSFEVDDYNSCQNATGTDEISDYIISIYRSGIGTTSPVGCWGSTTAQAASEYNPNNCYTSKSGAATWDISCTASTTAPGSCGGASDRYVVYDCTFPLWYVADPTASGTASTTFDSQDWRAAVSAVDDDGATTTVHTQSDIGQEVLAFLAFSLNTLTIPYGSVEPGDISGGGTLHATTTIAATGNIGLDQRLSGESMCDLDFYGVTVGNCPTNNTSTIADRFQRFSTTADPYGSGIELSSTTPGTELEVNVKKSTTTAIQATGITYWGIQVPATISRAGSYTGENTFIAVAGEPADW